MIKKNVAEINLIIKIYQFLYLVTIIMFALGPFMSFYFSNEKTLIFELYLPFVDHTTTQGYIITSLVHSLFLPIGYTLFVVCDLTFFVACYHIRIMAAFFQLDLIETKNLIHQSDFKLQKDCCKVKKKIDKIIVTHQNILR